MSAEIRRLERLLREAERTLDLELCYKIRKRIAEVKIIEAKRMVEGIENDYR